MYLFELARVVDDRSKIIVYHAERYNGKHGNTSLKPVYEGRISSLPVELGTLSVDYISSIHPRDMRFEIWSYSN